MKYLFILLFIPLSSFSQELVFTIATSPDVASFKSIARKSASEYMNDTTRAIRYPVIITSDDATTDKINNQIKAGVFSNFFKDIPNRQSVDLVDSFIIIGLNKMTYYPTLNEQGLLSLTVNYESCGANCVDTAVIFNFDTHTGKPLAIEDVVSKDNLDLFMKNVQVDKNTALNKYKTNLKNQLDSKDIELKDYTTAVDAVNNNCMTSVQLKNFVLTDSGIEIIDNCDLPHALQDIQPSYHLIYTYTSIKSLLNSDFVAKVLQ